MKKILLNILFISIMVFAITGCDLETTENTNQTTTQEEQTQSSQKEKQRDSKNEYMDALRKCSVMEAADIYNTGIGKKSENVFNDGREICESRYKQLGEKTFLETVNEDWKNRNNEEIDGKPLGYYLDILE